MTNLRDEDNAALIKPVLPTAGENTTARPGLYYDTSPLVRPLVKTAAD